MTEADKLLEADVVALAAEVFVAIFHEAKLGQEIAFGKVRKCLTLEFGKPTSASHYVYDAIELEINLIFERARVSARRASGPLILLPRGRQLLTAADPVAALRELL